MTAVLVNNIFSATSGLPDPEEIKLLPDFGLTKDVAHSKHLINIKGGKQQNCQK